MKIKLSLFSGFGCAPWMCGPMTMPFGLNIGFGNLSLFMPPRLPGCMDMMDTCSWMDTPVMRDTRMDWILSPQYTYNNIAQQCNSLYNVNSFNPFAPSVTPSTPAKTETEEEKKAREEKEAKEKKEKEEKAKKDDIANDKNEVYKKVFENLSKVISVNSSEYKDLKKKYDKALEEKDPVKLQEKLEGILKSIKPSTLKSAVLEMDDVKVMLYFAGFKMKDNALLEAIDIHTLRSEMKSKQNTMLAGLASYLDNRSGDKNDVLQFISTWNDTYNSDSEKGFIRAIASDMPDSGKLQTVWKRAAVSTANALLDKAKTFITNNGSNFPKLTKLKDAVTEALTPISEKSKPGNEEAITKPEVNKLADACDKLYAYLRMQEAALANRSIRNNYSKDINRIKSGTITEDIIIKETQEDLASENMTVPELDELPEEESLLDDEVEVAEENDDADDDDNNAEVTEHDKNGASRVAYLTYNRALKKVETGDGTEYYETRLVNGSTIPNKAYAVVGDKLVEIHQNEEGKYVIPESADDAKDVKIQDVLNYKESAKTIKELLDGDYISEYDTENQIYVSTGVDAGNNNHYYILKDNKFYEIKGCTSVSGTKLTIDSKTVDISELKNSDLSPVNKSQIPTAKANEEEKKAEVDKEKTEAEKTFTELTTVDSYNDFDNTRLDEIAANIARKTKDDKDVIDKFKKLKTKGYFKDTISNPNRFYKYVENANGNGGHLELLEKVTDISDTGIMTVKENCIISRVPCAEYITTEADNEHSKIYNYGAAFAKNVRWNTTDINAAQRSLNTFCTLNKVEDIVDFIEGYEETREFPSSRLAEQIRYEFEPGNSSTDVGTAKYFLVELAKKVMKIADNSSFYRNSVEYNQLKKIADGKLLERSGWLNHILFDNNTLTTVMVRLDNALEKILKQYREKYPKKETESEE